MCRCLCCNKHYAMEGGKLRHSQYGYLKHLANSCNLLMFNHKLVFSRTTPYTTPLKRPQQCWIPKKLLQAQGYYDGATHLWVLKFPKPAIAKVMTLNRLTMHR